MRDISVVIPNYNRERTLEACVRSALTQTYRPCEVIVVDDASTDRSREIARRLPCTLIEQPCNRGVSAARNAGAAASKGEVLFFLDSDEALAPDAIANAMAILEADPTCGLVHGVIAPEPLFDDGPIEQYRTLHAYWWRHRGAGEVQTAFFAQAAIRRTAFEAAGPFDERLRDSEDLEYSERLAPLTRILLTDSVVAFHDEVDRLWPLLRETFRRATMLASTLGKRKGRMSLTANRPLGILAVAAALATLPLVLVSPFLLALPALGVLAFALSDPGLLGYVARRKGWRFLLFFAGVHLLVHVALVAGAALGAARTLGLRRLLVPVVVAAGLAGVGLALRQDGGAALAVLARPAVAPLAAAALVTNLGGLLLGVAGWRVLVPIGGLNAARIFCAGLLSKYLPGRVWGVATHIELGRAAGVPASRMVSAYLLSVGLSVLTGAAVGLLALPRLWLGAAALPLVVALAWPQLLDRPLVAAARRLKRPLSRMPRRRIRIAVAVETTAWLVAGLHLWAIAVALGARPGPSLAVCVGAFALATVAGSLSVITPDGWGVRELTLTAILATVLPWSAAALAAVASRVVCVVVEVCTSLVVMALSARRERADVPSVLG